MYAKKIRWLLKLNYDKILWLKIVKAYADGIACKWLNIIISFRLNCEPKNFSFIGCCMCLHTSQKIIVHKCLIALHIQVGNSNIERDRISL